MPSSRPTASLRLTMLPQQSSAPEISPFPSPKLARRTPNSTHTYATSNSRAAKPAPSYPAATEDVIGSIIGDFGIWQLRTVLIIFLCKIPASWFMACILFTAPELYAVSEFECDTSALGANQTVSADQCYVLEGDSEPDNEASSPADGRQECTAFIYNFDFQSLIMEFDLVCARDIFVAWTQYWHLFGVLVGGVTATKMMLFISPRYVYFIGMIAQLICGCVTGFARDFSLHCAFRCLSAVCCAVMFTAGQAIFADITAGTYRLGAIILYDTFWSIGVIFLPSLSAFFNHWTHIYLGITFPTLLLILLLQWTPDSPRWLLKNGDDGALKQVEEMIREGAAVNERTFKIPPDFRQQLVALREKLRSQPAAARWPELWSGHRAAVHMIGAHVALAAYVTNFMGMLLNIRSFGRDYLLPNTVAMGFSEIVGCFLALHFLLKHNKWKWQWAGGFNILAGLIGCLGWTFSRSEGMDPDLKVTLWMIIATIPKAGVSCAQSMILACMAEVMPANKKAPFVFSVITWARVWLLSAPFLNVLKKIDVALSLSSYCLLSILGGICTCLLLTPRSSALKPLEAASSAADDRDVSALKPTVWTVQNDTYSTRL